METPKELSSKSNQYFVIAEHWTSDLQYFQVESNFFHHLLDRYASVASTEDLEKLKSLGEELKALDQEREKNEDAVDELRGQIVLAAEGKAPEDLGQIEKQHSSLEVSIAELTKKFRELKTRLFTTVQNID
ncbi:hypothetical protein [Pedobacter sp.]|uniref:hypothetical protein n=1 Tax=Pedobacter sp. TaxID=1411316 RepID=UPI003D7FEBB0